MQFLYFLEGLRNPVFDFFFELITKLGEETVFLVVAILFFWCINKREGYFILLSGLFGTLINQAMKLIFRIPRPWVLDPNFDIVGGDAVKEAASGYSFPSGHTQNISTTLGAVAAFKKGRARKIICITGIALVAFSRMYLGVHTPLDVGVSLVIGAAIILAFRPIFTSEKNFKRAYPFIVIGAFACSVAYLIFVLCLSGDATLDSHNYESGLKNACTLFGCTLGLVGVYFVDTYYVKFETEAKWYSQIIKIVVGLGGVLLIKSGLSSPLTALFGNAYIARCVRYFLIVVFAGAVWPMTFKFFKKLEIPVFDRFGSRVVSILKKDKKGDNAN